MYASKCMKKLQNNSLYKVGTKYGQLIDSTNLANKLPKMKNLYIELACRPCDAMPVAYPFGNCQAKMISQ